MEHGFAAAMTLHIATRAKVSQRGLCAPVGNKEEMLAAYVASRGQRMGLPERFPGPSDMPSLLSALRRCGETLLPEITDPDVLAVFRLGICEAKRSRAFAAMSAPRGTAVGRLARVDRARDDRAAECAGGPPKSREAPQLFPRLPRAATR